MERTLGSRAPPGKCLCQDAGFSSDAAPASGATGLPVVGAFSASAAGAGAAAATGAATTSGSATASAVGAGWATAGAPSAAAFFFRAAFLRSFLSVYRRVFSSCRDSQMANCSAIFASSAPFFMRPHFSQSPFLCSRLLTVSVGCAPTPSQ
jgi:hypothetical protein